MKESLPRLRLARACWPGHAAAALRRRRAARRRLSLAARLSL